MNVPKDDLIRLIEHDPVMINKYRALVDPRRTCECCGETFSPESRSDEKYCKNCRGIGLIMKQSPEYRSYRRAQKRLYASYRYGTISREQYDELRQEAKNAYHAKEQQKETP